MSTAENPTPLRPMSTSEILDRTFHLYRNHFWLFAGITLAAFGLTLVGRVVLLMIFGSEAMVPANLAQIGPFLLVLFITSVLFLVANTLAAGATVHAVSLVHLGRRTTIGEAYHRVKSMAGRLFGIVFMTYLIVAGPVFLGYGLLFAIVFLAARLMKGGGNPTAGVLVMGIAGLGAFLGILCALVWTIIATARLAVTVPACALEDIRVMAAIRRSWRLTRKNIGRIWLVILLTGIINFALRYILELPALIANRELWVTPGLHLSRASYMWIYSADFLGLALAGPIATIAMALIYYDQRIRKEAFDLQIMMDSITHQQTPLAVPNATSAATD